MIREKMSRNPNGTFKSAFDTALEQQEANWHAEIKARMGTGLSFDEAWIAAGGEIIPTSDTTPEAVEAIRKAYEAAGRRDAEKAFEQ